MTDPESAFVSWTFVAILFFYLSYQAVVWPTKTKTDKIMVGAVTILLLIMVFTT